MNCCFCSGVPPTEIGSLPRNVARTDVARPRSLGHEQELDAQLLAAHPAHQCLGELVALVELDQQRVGELAAGELADRFQRELERLEINAAACGRLSS
jgi:hypothetical protein